MPAFSRAIFLSLQAAALVATVGPSMAPLPVVAAPVPMSHIADYASQPPARTNATLPQVQDLSTSSRSKDGPVVDHTPSYASSVARRQDVNSLGGLTTELHDLLASLDLGDNSVIEAILALLDAIHQAPVLNDLAQAKGKLNYDPDNELETELKNIVDSLKYSLNAIDAFAFTLNPTLGEIVYLVKCIVDAILDTVENVTDGTINYGALTELQQLLAQLTDQSCLLGFVCPETV
ncbi:hypothetical protein L226DRAFT_556330 [Lentinus tigrinus ALCF2SS1-7]|uniref:uncharacterized protein n=1 Tax=Lentinus tigrinus ALCF2SS1-7 TaxID=1328758 RepID=UPI001165E923|nr:hypothetical protein L226DRAFT_556330 [Lentinus tigrinus ALCF2SS1-7]